MFLLLVLANLMFFGWANWVDRPAPRPRGSSPVPALQLASRSTAAPAASGARAHCRSLGSWSSEAAAGAASAVLARRGLAAVARRVDSNVADGYGVYVAAADADQQRRVLRQLERAGLRDAAAIGDGSAPLRVSAGVFSEQKGAEERASAVRHAGLDPVLEERHRTRSARWLDVQFDARSAEPRADDAEIAAGGATLQWSDCP